MIQTESKFSKLRWGLTIVGLGLYLVDILSDLIVAVNYFREGHLVWSGLTVLFVVVGSLTTQIFSYAWYRDDMSSTQGDPGEQQSISGMRTGGLIQVHVTQMGMFTRYYQLLMLGYKVLWSKPASPIRDSQEIHLHLFGHAADLSMLKLFETFLESCPQLLLQFYIMLGHGHCSIWQCISVACSLVNIAWTVVDYRRCLHRSISK
ncbi:hypothetical protein DPEC_G00079980, partial [Dallia pectoralis]